MDKSFFQGMRHTPSMWRLRQVLTTKSPPIRDFCIPVNCHFPPQALVEELRSDLPQLLRYYPTTSVNLAEHLSNLVKVPEENLVLGNGSTELISWIDELLVRERIVVPIPTFSRWTDDPRLRGIDVVTMERQEADGFRIEPADFVRLALRSRARAAVICNPNNPTGVLMEVDELLYVLDRLGGLDLIVIDESFLDFADENAVPSVVPFLARYPNLLVLRSLGKNLGLHGVRVGYAVTAANRATVLRDRLPFWNVNGIAEALLRKLPAYLKEYEAGRKRTIADARAFENELGAIEGLKVFPSRANFVYVKLTGGADGAALRDRLLFEHACLVRECGNKEGSNSQFLRLAARPAAERAILLKALSRELSRSKPLLAA